MRLVGYTRVSTASQALGDSTDAQAEVLRTWAAQERHSIVDIETDAGFSGALDENDRPGLLSALATLEQNNADALVVHRIDRLARALHVQEAILSRIWATGATLFEAVSGQEILRDDPDDPMRTFVRQVMGAAAQLERGMVVARLQGGRRRKSAQGGYVGGDTPFGYRRDGDRLAEVEDEQNVVIRIIELRRSMTFQAIADQLNSERISTKRGARWTPAAVRSVICRQSRMPPSSSGHATS